MGMFEQPGAGLAFQVLGFALFRVLRARGIISAADEKNIFDVAMASLEGPEHDSEQVRGARRILETMQLAAAHADQPIPPKSTKDRA